MSNTLPPQDILQFSIPLKGFSPGQIAITFCFPSPFRGDKIIELGGGNKPVFHPNMDARKLPGVDIVVDLEKPFPVESGSYDGVYSKFLIEHIGWPKVRSHISEIYRILKPNGVAVCVTANLKAQAKKIAEKTEWDGSESALIFANQSCPEDYHKSGFTPEYATRLFREAGFREVKILPYPGSMEMIIHADKSSEKLPEQKTHHVLIQSFYESMRKSEFYKQLESNLHV